MVFPPWKMQPRHARWVTPHGSLKPIAPPAAQRKEQATTPSRTDFAALMRPRDVID
jgi:hypothetical protein